MANNCFYDMTVVAPSREVIDRLESIMKYNDTEYYIYRVFDVYIDDTCLLDDGRVSAVFKGDVAWGINRWIDDDDDPTDLTPNGAHYTTLTYLSGVLGFSFEILGEETGNAYAQYALVRKGKVIHNEYQDYYDLFIESENDILDFKECAKDIMTPDEIEKGCEDFREHLNECRSFSIYLGGFDWFGLHEPAEIDSDMGLEIPIRKGYEVIS